MTVSAGVGGGSLVGVVLGGGAATGTGTGAPGAADVVSTLPFTGATHLEALIALAMVLLVVGALTVGLVRRSDMARRGSTTAAG